MLQTPPLCSLSRLTPLTTPSLRSLQIEITSLALVVHFSGRTVVILRYLSNHRAIYSHIIPGNCLLPFPLHMHGPQEPFSMMYDYTLTGNLGQSWT